MVFAAYFILGTQLIIGNQDLQIGIDDGCFAALQL